MQATGNGALERYWRAVLARDAGWDGAFVYGVRSTGIYCRPSCAARKPLRTQVVFFPLPAAAEQAGFRACRRCRPRDDAGRDSPAEMVRRACRYIDEHNDGPASLDDISAHAGRSPHYLRRMFKRLMGITPRQYADARRLTSLKKRLKEGETVTRALYDVGYGSSSRLYERAPEQLGMTPATYQRGGAGMRIGYTIVDCPLGRLLVAATERGVCAVSLGDSDAALEAFLAGEYPAAEIRRDDGGLGRWIGPFLGHLQGRQPDLDLPVDVRATAFQRRVWEELQSIPYGRTRTYGEIARRLGHPRAARAVARACATNPASIIIPCHRVVREDGGLGGYRWGVQRKQALLDLERASSPQAAASGRRNGRKG